jgi:hypothetical protein
LGQVRTVHHVDDDAELASKRAIVDEAHTAGLYQSPVRLCTQGKSRHSQCASRFWTHAKPSSVHALRTIYALKTLQTARFVAKSLRPSTIR